MMRRFAIATAAIFFAALGACKDTSNDPKPGYLEARMVSPNTDDGGIHFTVTGPTVDSISSPFAVVESQQANDSTWNVVVGGNIGTGVVARVWVPDTRDVARYSASVIAVVVRNTNAQRASTGYAVIVAAH